MSIRKPPEYTVTVIEGDEPLSEQAIQQVAKILVESKRKREEKNGKENKVRKLDYRTGNGVPGNFNGRKVPDRKVQRA